MKKVFTVTAWLALVVWSLSAAAVADESDKGSQGTGSQGTGSQGTGSQGNWLLAKYDLNGDSQITQSEITSKKRNIFKHMDNDNDGGVTFDEYENMDVAKRQALLRSRFNKLDIDQNGRLTEAEYTNYMGMFDSIDSDGDGTLTSVEMGVGEAQAKETHCLLWFCFRSSLD
ncbi:hypothetical protein FKG94_11545 [Exilibacterium tricleocarpae]|uniref:EF-hand domain-containing protein n=1 Tax=Exilibacterium tricleocarpae TaxID=2591008 RepID=A0A545TQK9_9GAMM|nr:EF-hand domain-containing protein [Exilibacterium tricleocarpae]TQV79494.1 hypothetical protein FKG94_11545 [Exilibacterium tricleocarpae]